VVITSVFLRNKRERERIQERDEEEGGGRCRRVGLKRGLDL
jgi:hypothetical protein